MLPGVTVAAVRGLPRAERGSGWDHKHPTLAAGRRMNFAGTQAGMAAQDMLTPRAPGAQRAGAALGQVCRLWKPPTWGIGSEANPAVTVTDAS